MKFLFDYLVLILSILGSVFSIVGFYNQNIAIESLVAVIALSILLFFSMIHDWLYTCKLRKRNGYIDLFAELNTAYSQIRNIEIDNVQTATNYLMTYCESVSSIFSTLKSHRIGVCVKLLIEDSGTARIITQARDQYSKTHNRKTGSADKTIHNLDANSDFSFIYNNIDNDLQDSTFFHSNNLIKETDYRNSRLNSWYYKPISFVPQNWQRRMEWPLPYKSTIVVPIFPLNSDLYDKNKLRGFLCIDSSKTDTFNLPEDKEILRGMAGELCPIIDKMMKLMK